MAEEPPADPGPPERSTGRRRPLDHDEAHELAIASLLDPGMPDDERAVAERLTRTCPACTDLHADLLSLAAATRGLPARARLRDFRLTAEDAVRLVPAWATAAGGEPHATATRLTVEMQVPKADHGTHDPTLVAGLLDRSTDGTERERAEALLVSCTHCAALHRDLIDLRAATRALPTPRRVRDYTISAEDARRLRRTGWRGLIAVFGSARDVFSRPLAIGLTTIGLAGLLVTTVPGALPGSSSTAAAPTIGQAAGDAGGGANSQTLEGAKLAPAASAAPSAPAAAGPAAAAPVATAQPAGAAAPVQPSGEPAPSAETLDTYLAAPAASPGAAAIAPAPATPADRDGAGRTSALSLGEEGTSVGHVAAVVLAGLLFAAGIGLFVLRWVGRRV